MAVRSGLTGATVRVGRGRVQVVNGIAEDIWAIFDGEIDALLRAGSSALSRELIAVHLGSDADEAREFRRHPPHHGEISEINSAAYLLLGGRQCIGSMPRATARTLLSTARRGTRAGRS